MTIFKNQVEELSIDECMKKWKALRDKTIRELKIKLMKSDSGKMYVSCWVYFDNMSFLKHSVHHRLRYFQFYPVSTYKHLLRSPGTNFSQNSETFQTLVDPGSGKRYYYNITLLDIKTE